MLKKQRTIKPQIAKEYNDLVDMVGRQEVVIYIVDNAYKEVAKNAVNTVSKRKYKKTGISLVAFALIFMTGPLGWTTLISASVVTLASLKDDFKKYKIKPNKEKERIELYLKHGDDKYDPKYDTIVE